MVVTEEEQGYAPAAHLEAVDKTYDSLEPECSSNEGMCNFAMIDIIGHRFMYFCFVSLYVLVDIA